MESEGEMFDEDLRFGTNGEDVVYNHLRHLPKTKHILDVSKSKTFQNDDIDFIVQTIDGEAYKVEVKNDRCADRTGNMFYETKSNSNVGCLARSKADYVFYITSKHIYCFNLKIIRNYIEKTKPNEISGGDNARGYLLKISELIEKGVMQEINGNLGRT